MRKLIFNENLLKFRGKILFENNLTEKDFKIIFKKISVKDGVQFLDHIFDYR